MSPSKRKRPTPGKSKGTSPGKRPPDREAVRRFGLLVFGAGLLALFAIVAISEGIGHPDVPSGAVAIVEEAPDGDGEITEAKFNRAMEQAAAEGKLDKVPKPSDPQYKALREGTLEKLLQTVWVKGQAAEMGISASKEEISEKADELKEQGFQSDAEYEKTLKKLHFTQADVNEAMELQILATKIQEQIREDSPEASDGEVEDYYEEVKATQFTKPATRDVRLIFNKDKKKAEQAKALLDKDSSPESWKRVAKKYSTESPSKNEGGLRRGVGEDELEEPLNAAVFDTPEDEVEGVIKAGKGFYVFEVEDSIPESVKSLDEAKPEIEPLLDEGLAGDALGEFVVDFEDTWRSRTFCASSFAFKGCANFEASSDPAVGDPTSEKCRTAEIGSKEFPKDCPAPVRQQAPGLPGTFTLQTRGGTGSSLGATSGGLVLAQRPRPVGLEEAEEALPTLPGGVPPVTP